MHAISLALAVMQHRAQASTAVGHRSLLIESQSTPSYQLSHRRNPQTSSARLVYFDMALSDEPIDATAIATDLVVALREVYDVDGPRDLEYHAFSENPSAMIVIPTLGIRRARVDRDSEIDDSSSTADFDDEPDDELADEHPRALTAGYL